MVISHGFLASAIFGGAPDVIGRRLTLGSVPVSIVGVTPANFSGIEVGQPFDAALPVSSEALINGRDSMVSGGVFALIIIARLGPAQTNEERDGCTAARRSGAIRETVGAGDRGGRRAPIRTSAMRCRVPSPSCRPRTAISFVRGAVRAAARHHPDRGGTRTADHLRERREPATGASDGAAPRTQACAWRSVRRGWRLVRSLLAEKRAACSARGAAGLGIPLAAWGSRLLVRQLSTETRPLSLDLTIDWRLLAFSLTIALTTLALFGVAPALRAIARRSDGGAQGARRAAAPEMRAGASPARWWSRRWRSRSCSWRWPGLFIQDRLRRSPAADLGFAGDELLVVQIESRRRD